MPSSPLLSALTTVLESNGFVKSLQSSKSIAKQLKVSNSFKLERHIKKTVDDLGMCNFNLPFAPRLLPDRDDELVIDWSLVLLWCVTLSRVCVCCQGDGADQAGGIAKSSEADIIDLGVLGGDFVELSLPQPTSAAAAAATSPRNKRKQLEWSQLREDKALQGLNRRQAELRLVSESNLGMLRRLLVAAKRDTRRQEAMRRLAVADADVSFAMSA